MAYEYCTFKEFAKHLRSGIDSIVGYGEGTNEVCFHCKDGYSVMLYHEQDCCESVRLESADGIENNADIYTGAEWCEVEFETRTGDKEEYSYTWTFYKFTTNLGYDTMRWYGESNGYYSEEVDYAVAEPNEDFFEPEPCDIQGIIKVLASVRNICKSTTCNHCPLADKKNHCGIQIYTPADYEFNTKPYLRKVFKDD